jgi:hypothetical protein
VNLPSILLWGFLATTVMSIVMAASQGLGLSRMGIPFILGTMVTADRRRAALYGSAIHLVNGWLFAFGYAAVFESLGRAQPWLGAALGLVHALAVLTVLLPALPGLHPRMASETRGPEPTRALEPPGFLALNYGRRTPLVAIVAHLVYGTVLGAFYELIP